MKIKELIGTEENILEKDARAYISHLDKEILGLEAASNKFKDKLVALTAERKQALEMPLDEWGKIHKK